MGQGLHLIATLLARPASEQIEFADDIGGVLTRQRRNGRVAADPEGAVAGGAGGDLLLLASQRR